MQNSLDVPEIASNTLFRASARFCFFDRNPVNVSDRIALFVGHLDGEEHPCAPSRPNKDCPPIYLDLVEVTTGECFKKFNLVGRK